MPGKTGFDMLAELDKAPDVIFTTAYDEYALEAFKLNSIGYIVKPVNHEQLADALHKYRVLEKQFGNGKVPRPKMWGGYRLEPEVFEFWQGRPSRLHDRLNYRLQGGDWVRERLAP